MKYKLLIFIFCVFLFAYLYISHLNQDIARLYVGNQRFYENTVADFVVVSFIVGVIFSFILGFFLDLKRFVGGWIEERREKRRDEIKEVVEKAKAYNLKGDREKAIDTLERLTRRSPDAEEPYLVLADLFTSTKEFDKAVDALNQAIMRFGKRESLLIKKVKISLEKKDTQGIESLLKDVLKQNEMNIEAMSILRDYYIGKKDWNNSIELERRLRRFIKTEDEKRRYAGILYEKAKESFQKGDGDTYHDLIHELKEVISEDKLFIPGYILLAEIYKAVGKPNESGRVYGRGYTKTGHIIFLLKMEDLYVERGDPGVILKIYRRILDISANNHLVSFLYARLCLRLEMIDEAIDTISMLFAEGKNFSGLHRAMAEAHAHRGQMSKAVEEFRKAFPMDRVYIPFKCDNCQAAYEEWRDFCDKCNSWNSIIVEKQDFLPAESTELQAIYEREALGERYANDEEWK